MKSKWLFMVSWVLLLPLAVFAQENLGDTPLKFYMELGRKDAEYELLWPPQKVEDELDLWNDQQEFETLLKSQKALGYQAYLFGKYSVYQKHQLNCDGRCAHSGTFSKKMEYYLTKGKPITELELGYAVKSKKRSPQD